MGGEVINWYDFTRMANEEFGTNYKNPKEMLIDLYHTQNYILSEIADMFLVSPNAIMDVMRVLNIPRRNKGWKKDDPELYANKLLAIPGKERIEMTAKEISIKIGCSTSFFYFLAKKLRKNYKKSKIGRKGWMEERC